MPNFDLRGIKVATYTNNNGTISYSGKTKLGDAMNVNLELKYAEGRLYAESTLAEYMKAATGGTISIGVKYIPDTVQKLLFGATDKTRTFTDGASSVIVTGLRMGAKNSPKAVGVAFYAPDMIDGEEKFTCVFISRAIFGPPSMAYATKGDSITFNTPTTTGEFMADHSTDQVMLETATCTTEAAAQAWVDTVLGA